MSKDSAIFHQHQFDAGRPMFERIVSLLILLASFVGAVVTLSGGWASVPYQMSLGGVLGGIFLQGACTATQWFYRRRKVSWQYLSATTVDTATTAAAYHPFVAPAVLSFVAWVLTWFGSPEWGSTLGAALSWAVMIALSLAGAILPEDRLID
jgi:hypothetical protein